MKVITAFLAVLCCVSCSQNEAKKKKENTAKLSQYTVVLKNDTISSIYTNYIALKDALVKSDSVSAKTAANKLSASLAVMSGCSGAVKMAGQINAAATIAEQRKQFAGISDEIIPVLKQADLQNGKIYVQFCPMANEKGSYWLSSDKQIKNPYYGDEMLECGEVKAIIN